MLASHNYWHWALFFIEKVKMIMGFSAKRKAGSHSVCGECIYDIVSHR